MFFERELKGLAVNWVLLFVMIHQYFRVIVEEVPYRSYLAISQRNVRRSEKGR